MYLDKYRLKGRTAFITGGGRGIGLATAEALLEAGAKVIISDHNQDLLDSGRAHIAGTGRSVETMLLDVTRPDDVARTARVVGERAARLSHLPGRVCRGPPAVRRIRGTPRG